MSFMDNPLKKKWAISDCDLGMLRWFWARANFADPKMLVVKDTVEELNEILTLCQTTSIKSFYFFQNINSGHCIRILWAF